MNEAPGLDHISETKQRILEAAEALFAEEGLSSTSLRRITTRAGVNLAAVNYHFGGKDELIKSVFSCRIERLNRERLRRLDHIEQRGLEVDGILTAFIAPALELAQDTRDGGNRFMKLLGRSYTGPYAFLREYIHDLFAEVMARFKQAFVTALPDIPREELFWRLHFVLGAMSYTLASNDVNKVLTDCEVFNPEEPNRVLVRLIPFLSAGLKAPLPPELQAHEDRAEGI